MRPLESFVVPSFVEAYDVGGFGDLIEVKAHSEMQLVVLK